MHAFSYFAKKKIFSKYKIWENKKEKVKIMET